MIIKGKFKLIGKSHFANGNSVCIVSSQPHNTLSQPTTFVPDLEKNGSYKPGTTWYVQFSRWTFNRNLTDIRQYLTETGTPTYYLGDTPVYDQGLYFDTGSFRATLANNPRSAGYYVQILDNPNNANESILMVAYTAGVPSKGLQVQYPNQTVPHPAVEFLDNGAWKNGSPVDGACQPVTLANLAQVAITFPGGFTGYDETGGMGSTGETASTVTTRGQAPSGSVTYPAFLSTASGLTNNSTMADLGFTAQDTSLQFSFTDSYGTTQTFQQAIDITQTTYVVGLLLDAINFGYNRYGLNATLTGDGRLMVFSLANNVTSANAFSFTGAQGTHVFGTAGTGGAPLVTSTNLWTLNVSTNLFTLQTPLAQFAPKGVFHLGLGQGGDGYTLPVIEFGVVVGAGQTYTGTAPILLTMGDLIQKINATMDLNGKQIATAYLENGRLVVALLDTIKGDINNLGSVTQVLYGRYDAEPLDTAGKVVWRECFELMYGASDYRFAAGFRYNDQAVGLDASGGAINLTFSGTTIAALPRTPSFSNAPYTLGNRSLTDAKKLSDLYPVGYLIRHYDSYYNNFFNLDNIEVSSTTTVGDLMTYMVGAGLTLRFVDSSNNHVSGAQGGYLRLTSGSSNPVSLRWYDPVSGNYGDANRLFNYLGGDGTVPTNVLGTVPNHY